MLSSLAIHRKRKFEGDGRDTPSASYIWGTGPLFAVQVETNLTNSYR